MAEARIHVLPEDLSNQIAAGEVVERPASAAKELVENSLDAGARRIFVEIEDGGRKGIRVVDDGAGMTRADALLAVRRHATSKVRTVEDLRAIQSLGFRGEALPSIASVSRFTLTTRPADEPVGTSVFLDGGGEPKVQDAGGLVGTTVDVRDLFFNVPARLKFMRSAATEMGHLSHLVNCYALGYPHVHFRLTHNGRVVSDYPAEAKLIARLFAVLGRDASRRLYEVYLDGEAVVAGFISEPSFHRPNPQQLFAFVNGRYVRDKMLYRAVSNAYGGLLDRGRYAVGALFVQVPPDEVDVNVHPTKSEVRFVHSGGVFQTVSRAIKMTLSAAPWIGTARPGAGFDLAEEPAALPDEDSPSTLEEPAPRYLANPPAGEAPDRIREPSRSSRRPQWDRAEGSAARTGSMHLDFSIPTRIQDADSPAEAASGASAEHAPGSPVAPGHPVAARPGDGHYFRQLQYIGQAKRTYLICQTSAGLVLIDQHAADERYHYERLRAAYREAGLRPQPLLFPDTLEVDPSVMAATEAHRDALLRMGLEVEPMGPRTIAIKGVPDLLVGKHYSKTVHDVLCELAESDRADALDERVDRMFATMACHTAVRAGDELSRSEARALLERMDATPFAANCPHGRPVLAVTPFAEVERWFHRR